jgi:hypothetical protein
MRLPHADQLEGSVPVTRLSFKTLCTHGSSSLTEGIYPLAVQQPEERAEPAAQGRSKQRSQLIEVRPGGPAGW